MSISEQLRVCGRELCLPECEARGWLSDVLLLLRERWIFSEFLVQLWSKVLWLYLEIFELLGNYVLVVCHWRWLSAFTFHLGVVLWLSCIFCRWNCSIIFQRSGLDVLQPHVIIWNSDALIHALQEARLTRVIQVFYECVSIAWSIWRCEPTFSSVATSWSVESSTHACIFSHSMLGRNSA